MTAHTGKTCTTPVVVIVFNRPEHTALLFEQVRQARPTTLFVISDGPRASQLGEFELVHQCREIFEKVDWECDVHLEYSDTNLGCRGRIVSGLDMVFSQVPEAIILEDDCIPHQDFFSFTSELLERMRGIENIFSIGGNIWEFPDRLTVESYTFGHFFSGWGWATWADRWHELDLTLHNWNELRTTDWLSTHVGSALEVVYWQKMFDLVSTNGNPLSFIWDYAVQFSMWKKNMLSVRPSTNLVHNVGFGSDATHTTTANPRISSREARPINWPLTHPREIVRNEELDSCVNEVRLAGTIRSSLFRRQ
jgi:hypothetical protein